MSNHDVIADLKPKKIWDLFAALSNIPRASYNEEGVRNWLIDLANTNNLEYKVDTTGNLVIYKPAQHSSSNKTLLLQGHMDMVTESDADKDIDFDTDPIALVQSGEWLMADRTTLGADNGIGLVTIVDILIDKNMAHPNIQALFTVTEEVGLKGAMNMDNTMIEADYVLNLDTEEDGSVYVSSAGSRDLECKIDLQRDAEIDLSEFQSFEFSISDLRGGHSGINIHENRRNAIKLLSQLLLELGINLDLRLVSFSGGNRRNAIPRAAKANILIPKKEVDEFTNQTNIKINKFLNYYVNDEPNIEIDIAEKEVETPFTINHSNKLLNLINIIPNGVLQMSTEIPNLVQTSNNIGLIQTSENSLIIDCMFRSNSDLELINLSYYFVSIFSLFDVIKTSEEFDKNTKSIKSDFINLEFGQISPGWQAQPDNELLDMFQQSHKKLTGKEAEVKAVHAGLECGVILSYLPNAKCISFGPQIEDAHSPVEKVNIHSVEVFYDIVRDLISKLAS